MSEKKTKPRRLQDYDEDIDLQASMARLRLPTLPQTTAYDFPYASAEDQTPDDDDEPEEPYESEEYFKPSELEYPEYGKWKKYAYQAKHEGLPFQPELPCNSTTKRGAYKRADIDQFARSVGISTVGNMGEICEKLRKYVIAKKYQITLLHLGKRKGSFEEITYDIRALYKKFLEQQEPGRSFIIWEPTNSYFLTKEHAEQILNKAQELGLTGDEEPVYKAIYKD